MPTPFTATRSIQVYSTRQLDDGILHLIHTALSPSQLQAHLKHALSKQDAINSIHITPHKIAAEFGATCTLVFQQAIDSISAQSRECADQSSDLLTQQIQRLCLAWAHGKAKMPENTFFQAHLQGHLQAQLQAQWQRPVIQSMLRHTSAQLRQHALYGEWLDRYPTCWAYTFGTIMHQLLQWNHRLTPAALRESWPIETAS